MTHSDYALTSLCLWREARGEGHDGMMAVACVLRNRVNRHHSTYFAQVVKKWAFSSMTAPGDPQLILFPVEADAEWIQAQAITLSVIDGGAPDTTSGATLYYDDSISFPKSWNPAVVESVGKVGRLNLYREL